MALRCGCYDQADDIVFGPRHNCTVKPEPQPQRVFPRLIPSSAFVVPGVLDEGVHAANISAEVNRLEGRIYDPDLQEARIHQTLGEDELYD